MSFIRTNERGIAMICLAVIAVVALVDRQLTIAGTAAGALAGVVTSPGGNDA